MWGVGGGRVSVKQNSSLWGCQNLCLEAGGKQASVEFRLLLGRAVTPLVLRMGGLKPPGW